MHRLAARRLRGLAVVASIAAAVHCGGDGSGSPAGSAAPIVPAGPPTLAVNAGDGQSAIAGQTVAVAPSVRLTSASGVPVAGASVTFVVATGGGTITGAGATTSSAGIATVAGWTLGATVGSNTLTATASGAHGSPVTFTATGMVGPPKDIAVNAGGTQTVIAGSAVGVAPSVKVTDAGGNPVPGTTVTFAIASGSGSITGASQTTSGTGVATVGGWTPATVGANSLTATVAGLAAGPVTFTATGTVGAAAKLVVTAAPSATVQNRVLFAAQPIVQVQDANGNLVTTSVASVAAAITAGGGTLAGSVTVAASGGVATFTNLLIAGLAGARTLTFSSAGLTSGTSSVTTTPGSASKLAVSSGNNQVVFFGTLLPVPVTALVSDLDGNGVAGVAVTFAVVSGGGSGIGLTQTTNSAGLAAVGGWTLGPAPGTNTMSATSAGLTGSPILFAATGASTSIVSVSPASLTPGSTATITGTGFSSTPSANAVTIAGRPATVLTASPTQLTATVPCALGGSVPVAVTAGGLTSNSVTSLLVGTTQSLSVGQSVALLSEAAVRCNELANTGGRYLISVFNTSTAPAAHTAVIIRGATTNASPNLIPQQQSVSLRAPAAGPRLVPAAEAQSRAANARAHMAMLERNREIDARLRSTPGYLETRRSAQMHSQDISRVVVPLAVGATTALHFVSGSSCNTFSNISARVVFVSAHATVLEDVASPTAGQIDPDLVAMGQLFETALYPIEGNFGDINAYDALGGLDNPGRVLMLFTPQENVPGAGGTITLGHVITCDIHPATLPGNAGSNQTKIFYARAVTSLAGSAFTTDTRAWWKATMPGTLVHEAKHLTSYAEHNARGTTREESWLEEATAQVATEIYSRAVYAGSGWKSNTTYNNSVFCDFRVGSATCPGGQFLMRNHFTFLQNYWADHEDKSFLSSGFDDPDIYGSAWMFVRWLVDQYGGSTESTILKALVQEPNLTGVENVTAKTGQAFGTLLADWTMMLAADDYPGLAAPPNAKYTFPSWNVRTIWAGYAADQGAPANPLSENFVSFGTFTLSGTLAGAAAGIIELSGTQSGKQLLDLSGLPTGSTIRMSILRVQ